MERLIKIFFNHTLISFAIKILRRLDIDKILLNKYLISHLFKCIRTHKKSHVSYTCILCLIFVYI